MEWAQKWLKQFLYASSCSGSAATQSTYCCLKSGTAFILRIMFPFPSCCVYQLQHDAVITGGMNRLCEIASAAEPTHGTRLPLPAIESHAFQAKLSIPQETHSDKMLICSTFLSIWYKRCVQSGGKSCRKHPLTWDRAGRLQVEHSTLVGCTVPSSLPDTT